MIRETEPLTLVIMAAGMGSRFGGVKQIEPVGEHGELIIDYSVYDAIRAGFERIVFVVRDEIERALRGRFDAALESRCEVSYVHQRLEDLPAGFRPPAGRAKPWGTGQAVLACRDVLRGPFAVINADDFYGRHGYELLAAFLAGGSGEHAVVGFPIANTLTEYGTVSRGICEVSEDGYLASIIERKRVAYRDDAIAYTEDGDRWHAIAGDAVASMNMWGFSAAMMSALEVRFESFLKAHLEETGAEFFIPGVVGDMVAESCARVRVLQSPDAWFGVTYREDLARTRDGIGRLVDSGAYPALLWG